MTMPNTTHAQTTVQRPEFRHQETSNLFHTANNSHHHPSEHSINATYATLRSEPVPLHMANNNMTHAHHLPSSHHGLPDFRHFNLDLPAGIDLDEWMYELAPKPEFNDHSAFMMNLGAIGGHSTFGNMFTHTDLS